MKIRRDSISFCRLPLFAVLSGVVLLGLSSVGEVRADEAQKSAITTIVGSASTTTNDASNSQNVAGTQIDSSTCEIETAQTVVLWGCKEGKVTIIIRSISELAEIDQNYWTPLTDTLIAEYPQLAHIDSIGANDSIHRELCGTATSGSSASPPWQSATTPRALKYVVVNTNSRGNSSTPTPPSGNTGSGQVNRPPTVCDLRGNGTCPQNNGQAASFRNPTLSDRLQSSQKVYMCN